MIIANCSSSTVCYKNAVDVVSSLSNSSVYSPNVFPLFGSTAVLNITVQVIIFKLISLTNSKELTVAMEVDLSWHDPNIPADWSSLPKNVQLSISSSAVWTMNLYLVNPVTPNLYLEPSHPIFVYPTPDGSAGAVVKETIIDKFAVLCEGMELVSFPFDSQVCTMDMKYLDYMSGGYTNFLLNDGVQWSPSDTGNDEWKVNNISLQYESSTCASKSVYCGLIVKFSFSRNAYYYVLFLIVPTILLQVAAAMTFVLPSDRGEKVVLGATLVLAVYVLLGDLNKLIPQVQADSIPRLVVALEVGFALTALALLEGVIVQTLRIIASDLPESVHRFLDRCFCSTLTCKASQNAKNDYNAYQNQDNDCSHSLSTSSANAPVQNAMTVRSFSQPGSRPSETMFLLEAFLTRHRKNEERRNLMERAWRKLEYSVNFTMLIVYAVAIVYFFGFYIHI